jgi:hypothetical protein
MLTYEIYTNICRSMKFLLQSAVARVFTTSFTGIRTYLMELIKASYNFLCSVAFTNYSAAGIF